MKSHGIEHFTGGWVFLTQNKNYTHFYGNNTNKIRSSNVCQYRTNESFEMTC